MPRDDWRVSGVETRLERAHLLDLELVEALGQRVEARLHLVPQPPLGCLDSFVDDPLYVREQYLAVESGQYGNKILSHVTDRTAGSVSS